MVHGWQALGELQGALKLARQDLPRVDNLGRSSDARNAYVIIDRVVAELKQAYPDSLCQPGCGRCCRMHRAAIRVYRSEWDPVYDYLVGTWSPERLAALVARFYAVYDPYLSRLRHIQAQLDAGQRPRIEQADLPVSCPLLLDGSCSIYPVRPAICRGYGHFELTSSGGERTEVFACTQQRAVLEAQLAPMQGVTVRLPSFNPFYQAVADVCRNEEKLLIPLWFERSFARPTHPAAPDPADRLPF